jgi:hypothetical protein
MKTNLPGTVSPIIRRRAALAWGVGMLVVASSLAGCGRPADIPRPASLRGRVTWRGKPLAYAMVYAVSEAAPNAGPASAQTEKNGTYTMAGVAGGRVRIAVVTSKPPDAAPDSSCDPKYADWRTSDLAVDTTAGETTFDIALQ